MARVKRSGQNNRIIVRNSKVYASTLNSGKMNGLFAFRNIQKNEILVQYTGPVLTQTEANNSSSDFLFDVLYRAGKNSDRLINKTIDGRGNLMGFANHAPEHLANAFTRDLMSTIIDHKVPYEDRHSTVLIAKHDIEVGTEIRFDYNADQDDSEMVEMMKKRGVTDEQINSSAFLSTRYVTPVTRNQSGIVEADFRYHFLNELYLSAPLRAFG